jgi:hypothetical protein
MSKPWRWLVLASAIGCGKEAPAPAAHLREGALAADRDGRRRESDLIAG